MTEKPHPRRGLGRGLGSLIPTAPRHERRLESVDPESVDPESVDPESVDPRSVDPQSAVERSVVATDGSDATASTASGPLGSISVGTADWIGVPLPGDGAAGADAGVTGRTGPTTPADDGRHRSSDPTFDSRPPQAQVVTALRRDGQAGPRTQSESETGDGSVAPSERPSRPESTDDTTRWDDGGTREQAAVRAESPAPDGTSLASVEGAWFAELPISDISPNPRQPREVFDEESMAELVASIRQVGLLQPVVVRPVGGDRYELVMGERRWRATQQAGLVTIPAIVRQTGDDELLRDALLENLHRAQLNALEEAAAYQQLLEDFGCTHDDLAHRIGRSRPQISNTIRLLKLSPAVQRRVAAGVLSAGHARALLAVDDAEVQDRLAGRVVAEGLSVRSLEEIVAVGELGSGPVTVRRRRPTAPGVDDLAARLSEVLETRVRVDLGKRKGRITVEFASLPDLERIVRVIDPGHVTRHDVDS
jgi:ParB family transcriptional regulator, chromosome partitioning protein